jgi:hypothetical protein
MELIRDEISYKETFEIIAELQAFLDIYKYGTLLLFHFSAAMLFIACFPAIKENNSKY